MELKEVMNSPRKIFQVIAGSRAYGLATAQSDTDIRGLFSVHPDEFMSFNYRQQPPVDDKKSNIIFYELREFFNLVSKCNPNILELLWIPEDCIQYKHNCMDELIEKRKEFISLQAIPRFSGYAVSQIKRAKGRNKWINNPKPEDPPEKEDFCWIIQPRVADDSLGCVDQLTKIDCFPCRPTPLKDFPIDLNSFHCSSLEHVENTYRLYYYGKKAKGVFRNGTIVCESIPKEDEWIKFAYLFIFNEQEYNKAKTDWHNYWEWKENRNEDRWIKQESGELDYDSKNMMHCIRLLLSGLNIAKQGEPIIRFEKDERQLLLDIRYGKYEYKEIEEMAESMISDLDNCKNDLPKHSDLKKLDELYRKISMEEL